MTVNPTVARAARLALWMALIIVAIWAGLALRDWTFEATRPIRFRGDVENAVWIGRRVVVNAARQAATRPTTAAATPAGFANLSSPTWPQLLSSYLDVYDVEYARVSARGEIVDSSFRLDYPPGRLLIVSAWCKLVANAKGLQFGYSDEIVRPMLTVNSVHEFLAAVGAGAIVWQALRRSGASSVASESLAMWAGALLWFNPALILDAHGWPQWDAWVLPCMLWAAFFALRDRWMVSGALLAAGSLFKGQVLLIAPLFVLWPIFQFRFGATLRLVVGMAIAFAIAGSPWLIFRADTFARWWAAIAIGIVFSLAFWPRAKVLKIGWLAASAIMLVWLSLAAAGIDPIALPAAVIATAGFCATVAFVRNGRFAVALAAAALVIVAAGFAFHGSFAWVRIGFQTDHYPELNRGSTVNLAAILGRSYGFDSDTLVDIGGSQVSLRILLRWIAYGGVAVASLGVALRDRSRDANVIVGLVASWTILYALMPQMHERYLVWAAATSAMLAARSVGGLILHLSLTALQVSMLLCSMIESNRLTEDPTFGPVHFVARGMTPAAGWSTLTLAGVLLVWSFSRSRRRVIDTADTLPAAA